MLCHSHAKVKAAGGREKRRGISDIKANELQGFIVLFSLTLSDPSCYYAQTGAHWDRASVERRSFPSGLRNAYSHQRELPQREQ